MLRTLSIALFCLLSCSRQVGAGPLGLSGAENSYGILYVGEDVLLNFPFSNDGREPVTIRRIEFSCGCTSAGLVVDGESMVVPVRIVPGEGGVLEATVQSTHHVLGKEVSVFLHLGDGTVSTLTATGDFVAKYYSRPRVVEFGRVDTSVSLADLQAVAVEVRGQDAFRLSGEFVTPPWLEVVVPDAYSDEMSLSHGLELRVSQVGALGPQASVVELAVDGGDKITIPVAVDFFYGFYFMVDRADFGAVPQGEPHQVEIPFVVSAGFLGDRTLDVSTSLKAVDATIVRFGAPDQALVITVPASAKPGIVRDVCVVTDNEGAEVGTLPVLAMIRPS